MKYKGIESLKHEIQSIADHSKRPHIVRGFGNALGGHFVMPLAGILSCPWQALQIPRWAFCYALGGPIRPCGGHVW